MEAKHTVLVLGGGVGGIVAAVALRKKLPSRHRIVLVDREQSHLFAPSLLWLMTGLRQAAQISRPLEGLRRKGIEILNGEIEQIEPTEHRVTVNGQTLAGDYLVVSLGAELASETIPGLTEAGHNLYTLAGAESLREARANVRSGNLVVLTASPAYKCPAAPYEAAMLLEYDCRRRGVRTNLRIDLYAAEPGPMGVAGPEVSTAVRRLVEAKGIGYHPEHQVAEVDPAGTLVFANGGSAEFALLAYVPPHRAVRVVRECGLAGESGWVVVNRSTLETQFPGVYALGDVVSIPLKMGKPLPKAGVFAHGEAAVVAHNIAHAISGRDAPVSFDGTGDCFIETGDGTAAFGRGDFYAEPTPKMKFYQPSRRWHQAKVLFEKAWLRRWF